MTPHETVKPLLPLSAAGFLGPEEERIVRQHVAECAECAAALAEFGEVAEAVGELPAPQPSPELVARTQAAIVAELAAHSPRRHNPLLAAGLGVFAWGAAFTTWALWRLLTGGPAAVLHFDLTGIVAWLAVSCLTLFMATPAAAALAAARRRKEGNHLWIHL